LQAEVARGLAKTGKRHNWQRSTSPGCLTSGHVCPALTPMGPESGATMSGCCLDDCGLIET
jgi:hypothetical protein